MTLYEKYIKSKTKVVLWIVTPGLGGIVNDDGFSLKEIKFRVKLADNFKEASTSAEKTEVFLFVERRLPNNAMAPLIFSPQESHIDDVRTHVMALCSESEIYQIATFILEGRD